MFRKIVSNLSFSSALVGQLAFYAKRLRKEEATRRIGLIFVALALVVQGLVVFDPPQPANAIAAADLVPGGLGLGANRSLNKFLVPYDANTGHLKDIMNYAGITRAEIASAQYSSFLAKSNTLDWGRVPYAGDQPIDITNTTGTAHILTVYAGSVAILNGTNTRIYAWIGHSAKIGWFAIMQACGNLVTNVIPPPPKPPVPKCTVVGKTDLDASDSQCFVNCAIPGKTSIPATSDQCFAPCTVTGESNIPATSSKCKIPLCPYPGLGGVAADSILCKPPAIPAHLIDTKTALNITQGKVDATTVTAQANDEIQYTITAKNTGGTATNVDFQDNLADALDYSTLLDNGGGTFDSTTKTLSWPSVSIGAGDSQSRQFVMQMLSSIPSTEQGQTWGASYDCKIINTFGNTITINVACPVAKVVEQTVTQLPHTGPTENMLFAGIVLAVVAYFYLRSRQVGKEVRLIRRDLNAGAI